MLLAYGVGYFGTQYPTLDDCPPKQLGGKNLTSGKYKGNPCIDSEEIELQKIQYDNEILDEFKTNNPDAGVAEYDAPPVVVPWTDWGRAFWWVLNTLRV